MSSRIPTVLFGFCSYLIGLGGLTWFILYIGGWSFLPSNINSAQISSTPIAWVINIGLLLLFGIQHSVMARPKFKEEWTQVISPAIERSTYVLLSGVIMSLFCLYWQPIDGIVWQTDNNIMRGILITAYLLGWTIAVISTFLINHFELFGLQQVYYHYKNRPQPKVKYVEKLFYKIVRHPLQFGILVGIWATPTMTSGHLMLSIGLTIYIQIGLYFEERDLVAVHGDQYRAYQASVPKLIPLMGPVEKIRASEKVS